MRPGVLSSLSATGRSASEDAVSMRASASDHRRGQSATEGKGLPSTVRAVADRAIAKRGARQDLSQESQDSTRESSQKRGVGQRGRRQGASTAASVEAEAKRANSAEDFPPNAEKKSNDRPSFDAFATDAHRTVAPTSTQACDLSLIHI